MKKNEYICKWCCAKKHNETFVLEKNTISTRDCQFCSICNNNCISGTFMTNCEWNE